MVTVCVSAIGEGGFSTMASLVRTILVVEHGPSQGQPVTRHFSFEPHHHAKVVTSAAAALNFVEYIKPNLFLLEQHLPDIDGLALYELLRETKELASIPAIIFGVLLPTRAHTVIKTQRVELMGTLIELEELGIDVVELGIPFVMN